MGETAVNAFIGKPECPTDADLAAALGRTKAIWDSIIATMAERFGVSELEWRCYSPKSGWAVKLKKGKRVIVWMAPCQGYLQVMYILGGKAMTAIRASEPSARMLEVIDAAEKYPEGWGMRIPIKAKKDLAVVEELAKFKLRY